MPNADSWNAKVSEARLIIEQLLNLTRQGQANELAQMIWEKFDQIKGAINQVGDTTFSCLHDAARRHDLECLKTLVQVANVNLRTKEGLTPLHFAAKYAQIMDTGQAKGKRLAPSPSPHVEKKKSVSESSVFDEVIQFLCENGAILDDKDHNGMTALHYAASRNNEEATKQLIEQGADLESMDNEKMTPLLMATRNNHHGSVQLLLDAGANVMARDRRKCNIFHHACHNGDSATIRTVNEHVQNKYGSACVKEMLNSHNVKHETPLHFAILSESYDATELCKELGADTSICNAHGESPLHLAAQAANMYVALSLLSRECDIHAEDEEGRTPIFNAVEYNRLETLTVLIGKGADINHQDNNLMTPLLLAADMGHVEVCELLIGHQASALVEDKEWKTPLMLAVEGKHKAIVEMLLGTSDGEALLEWEDSGQNKPLHAAVQTGSLQITNMLLKYGAVSTVKNSSEHTPLHVAAMYGRCGIVHKLLELTPIVAYERDEDDNFAAHLAAKNGFPQVLKKLLDHASQIRERNSYGWTPLTFAAAYNRLECVKLLLEEGADVNTVDKSMMTPLFLACRGGHIDVVNMLLEAGADPGIRVSRTHDQYGSWNALDIAVDGHKELCVQAILKSDTWDSALRNQTYESPNCVITPLRKMICDMPAAAELAMSRCVVRSTLPKHSEHYSVTYNFEFVDDWDLSVREPRRKKSQQKSPIEPALEGLLVQDHSYTQHNDAKAEDVAAEDAVLLSPDVKPPSSDHDSSGRKRIHPVKEMLYGDREQLLHHPLVVALLSYKWTQFCIVYYVHLAFYVLFLSLFTAFMLQTRPPYLMFADEKIDIREKCERLRNTSAKAYFHHIEVPKYSVMILSVVNLISELLQLLYAKWNYFNMDNLLEVAIFSLALITTIDTSWCMQNTGLREVWQWGTGTAGIFLAWINLLLFIRKGPVAGIFVIMFVVVMKTFIKFFVVFSPFLLAFGLSFHALLSNQIAFRDFKNSMLKTFAMVIGELDTNSIMFERLVEPEMEKQVYYEAMTYILFAGFITLMSIVMMNLLVGLAVDDIKGVQRKAAFIRQQMKINMLFSTETLLSRFKRNLATPKYYVYTPNCPKGLFDKTFDGFYRQAARTAEKISQIQLEEEDDTEKTKKKPEKRLEELQLQMLQVAKLLNQLVDHVNARPMIGPRPVMYAGASTDHLEDTRMNRTADASAEAGTYSITAKFDDKDIPMRARGQVPSIPQSYRATTTFDESMGGPRLRMESTEQGRYRQPFPVTPPLQRLLIDDDIDEEPVHF